ncbi:MarR family winged helix-turn-helix transcriptional regulator [Micromonospora coxensis]|uniref:MarR family winged helix-turn-helix transcriptional regulator n=1 Tax=Micromonospora coxensis TaxID=356852 RepID=UPI00342A97D2
MTDTPEAVPAHSMFTVLAALGALGEATAGAVAEHAGLGYSTVTAKLRAWEQTGQCERIRADDGRTLWRLTDIGRTAAGTATPDGEHPAAAPAVAGPADHGNAGDEPKQSIGQEAPPQGPPAGCESDRSATPDIAAHTVTAPVPDDAQEAPEPTPNGERPGPAEESSGHKTRQDRARRAKGSLRGAVLDILEAHPDRAYKTGELCRLIDAANAGGAKASAGAVANAVTKLVADGKAVQTVERPATYQLAPASSGQ